MKQWPPIMPEVERLASTEQLLRLRFGQPFGVVAVSRAMQVWRAALELRRQGLLAPILVLGPGRRESVLALTCHAFFERHPAHYAYAQFGGLPLVWSQLSSMHPLPSPYVRDRHLHRYAVSSGLLRVVVHDLRNALLRLDAPAIRRVCRQLLTLPNLPATLTALARRCMLASEPYDLGRALVAKLDEVASADLSSHRR